MTILYMVQTRWNWILQRSQIIELGLEKKYDCEVLDCWFFPEKPQILNSTKPQKISYVFQFRGAGKIKLISRINKTIYSFAVKKHLHGKDAVWLCSPAFYEFIPKSFSGEIIYDCMDDHVALSTAENKFYIQAQENELIKRADIIFSSSERLKQVKPGLNKAYLIRNGFVAKNVYEIKEPRIKGSYSIGYFGAIDTWFDFDILLYTTKIIENIKYRLWGPYKKGKSTEETEECLRTGRILLEGMVAHDDLYQATENCDAFIMPFQINDVILAVDPVKLYEYISFGKPVISVWYPEIERFSPYVYFYHNKEELVEIISYLEKNGFRPKYSKEMQESFLEENSWDRRCKDIVNYLESSSFST